MHGGNTDVIETDISPVILFCDGIGIGVGGFRVQTSASILLEYLQFSHGFFIITLFSLPDLVHCSFDQ